ncbi:MAG TPA: hypothetical protein VKA68_17150 [bacterium]|nr:hypothetical protein [bacterium]
MAELTEKVLRKHLQEDPQSTLFAQYADLLLEQDRVDQAYLLCIQGMKAHPKFATGWLILGKAALRRDERTFAKRCWMNALAADKMCLSAARLLLTTENLDLTLREAYAAAIALLNVDRNHLLARATMQLIQKRRTADSGEKSGARESEARAEPVPEKADRDRRSARKPAGKEHPPHLTKFDLYGKDKQRLKELGQTIEQMRVAKATDRKDRETPEERQAPAEPETPQTEQRLHPDEFRKHLDDAQEAGDGTGRAGENAVPEDPGIPAKMATLTFVRVLKAQGLYENALTVLNMIQSNAADQEEMAREKQELTHLLETQEH